MLQIQLNPKAAKLEERLLKFQRKRRQKALKNQQKAAKKSSRTREKKRAKEPARSRRNCKRIKFSETKLGRLLLVHAPLEYQMLCDATDPDHLKRWSAGIVVRAVETIAYASDNPVFHTPDFRLALIDFRRFNFYSKSKRKWCVRDALTASQNRQKQIRLQDG